MPNIDELLHHNSAALSRNDLKPIWISVIDLDYGYGQMKLTSKRCNFAITGVGILRNSRHLDYL